GEVGPLLADLWDEVVLRDRKVRRAAWNAVIEYWSEHLGSEACGVFHGHAALHAMMAGDVDDAVARARRYEAWSRSAESEGVYFSPAWPDLVARMPELLEHDGRPEPGARAFAAECVVRGSRLDRPRPGERAAWYPIGQRRDVWSHTLARLAQDGHQRIALFGAGRHTHWLLKEDLLNEHIEIVCIIDDQPSASTVCGVPLITPAEATARLEGVTALLPSSDAFEPQLLARAHELFGHRPDLEVRRVYTASDAAASLQPGWQYTVDLTPTSSRTAPLPLDLSENMPERTLLGLPERRDWTADFIDRFTPPDWATGYTNHLDSAFLWDVLEATRPRRLLEIGTASGISTAMLLAGADRFCPDDALVYSFDLASHCYFDADRPLAAAIADMAPELAGRARLFARANAIDAASCFRVGDVDFAFIDGNHAHPAPTLDLIALLYALRPGAWVVLHDIEDTALQQITPGADWGDVTGAEQLFRAWPWAKVQPSGDHPAMRNVGAIRMPAHPADAVGPLLDMLRGRWEMQGPASPGVIRALERHWNHDE
ncbi:MAG: class I SAM-dependent methyltransferase, partial [Phycisphaerales bacterium]|nr:class I SAM-dependent methyltransferase [Phycisphaerales bacterium]